MAGRKRVKKERRARMELILDSAIKLIVGKGYSDTSIKDIADDADFSRASIYEYFTTKEKNYVRTVENYTNLFSERLLEATKRASTVIDRIGVFLDEMRTMINVKPHFFQWHFI